MGDFGRGAGDEGAALDLAELAEQDIEPRADWSSLWLLLFALEQATGPERDDLVTSARAAVNGNSLALNILGRALEKIPENF